MRTLCEDVCQRHEVFRHIRMPEVAVTYAQTRSPAEWGMQAKLTPLRFAGGSLFEQRGQHNWTVQRVYSSGREMLYILTFYLPRFLNLSFDQKLITVFHELFHISPRFDGDIRRFGGACYMHTGSQKAYDRQMELFAGEYLRRQPPEQYLVFLRQNFEELQKSRGPVVGLRVNVPRLIRLGKAA